MSKPQQKSIATLVLLVLAAAANSALYFDSFPWWSSVAPAPGNGAGNADADSAAIKWTLIDEQHDLSSSEFQRRLAHEPTPLDDDNDNADIDTDADIMDPNSPRARAIRGLESKGLLEPGTELYARVLEKRVEYKLHQLRLMYELRMKNRHLREGLKNDKPDIWLRTYGKGEKMKEWRADGGVLAEEMETEMEKLNSEMRELKLEDYEPLAVCDRLADIGTSHDLDMLQQYAQCAEITNSTKILLLNGMETFGRTGNNLIELLHAIQYARDNNVHLGIQQHSWAMKLILKMWMAVQGDDWEERLERALCIKIFHGSEEEVEEWDVIRMTTKDLFTYHSQKPLGEYMASQEYSLRTLFQHYNTGEVTNHKGELVEDMCSGINAIFGTDKRKHAIYSVIHDRYLEGGPGLQLLGRISKMSGCDPEAALSIEPEYVKSILRPLEMMDYPIVVITDGENVDTLARLLADPEIGHQIQVVPEEACWIGGDLTLGIMSNVFIGNPASTFSGFIAKARLAMGFGHNYLFRVKDVNGEWKTVCGDSCVFDRTIMGSMY